MSRCQIASLGIFVFIVGCNLGKRASNAASEQEPTQQQDEAVMMMALHHNRDEVFAHSTSLGDLSWQRTPEGLRNWDCSLAIIEKHNQKYPSSPWELEGIELRNKMFGPPAGERLIAANACAEQNIQDAQHKVDLNNAFQKR